MATVAAVATLPCYEFYSLSDGSDIKLPVQSLWERGTVSYEAMMEKLDNTKYAASEYLAGPMFQCWQVC